MNSKALCVLEDHQFLPNSDQIFLKKVDQIVQEVISDRTAALPPGHDDEEVHKDLFAKVLVLEDMLWRHIRIYGAIWGRFMEEYPQWKKFRVDSIEELKGLADSIKEYRHNCNVSKIVESCTSALGGLLTLGGTGMTIMTGGAAAPWTFAAAVMIAIGAATTFGTSVLNQTVLLQNKVEEARYILFKEREHYEKLIDCFKIERELREALDAVLSIEVFGVVTKVVKELMDKRINDYLLTKHKENRLVFDAAALTIRDLLGSLLDGTEEHPNGLVRGAVTVVGTVLHETVITLESIDIEKRSQAEKILAACKEMETEAKNLESVFQDLKFP